MDRLLFVMRPQFQAVRKLAYPLFCPTSAGVPETAAAVRNEGVAGDDGDGAGAGIDTETAPAAVESLRRVACQISCPYGESFYSRLEPLRIHFDAEFGT